MNLKAFPLDDDRGVSPVIGVILMVAITVILAAVIATFVMNMGPGEAQQPNVQWEWNDDGTDITLSHTGGDAADPSEFSLQATDGSDSDSVDLDELDSDEMTSGSEVVIEDGDIGGTGGSASADEFAIASDGDDPVDAIDEITLVWENPNNDQTQEVDTYEP